MSDNYRALTRTYRPTSFEDIVSQEHVSNTLMNAIEKNRLAHAYMFCGPRGVGKTTMARVLARTINQIDQNIDGESLNQTLNVVEIDAASNNKVDDIRDLRERVRIPPQNGRYKVFIIDEVHMLSKSAFNALLKTLEEPPDHVIFIFATTEPHKVLPTILSRVQRFDFKRISIEEIVDHLKSVAQEESIDIDEESLHVIAKKADGALRDALGLMDQAIAFCGSDIKHEELLRALNVVSTERMFDFMKAVEKRDTSEGLELINELLQEGYDIQEYLVGLTEHLRNLYVAKSSTKMHLVEASPNMKKRYQEASKPFSEDDLMRMLHIVSEAQFKLKEAHQPKIQFEITLLKLIHMERSENLNALMKELNLLKKKFNNSEQHTSTTVTEPSDLKNGSRVPNPKREKPSDKPSVSSNSADSKSLNASKNAIETSHPSENPSRVQETSNSNSGETQKTSYQDSSNELHNLLNRSSLGTSPSKKTSGSPQNGLQSTEIETDTNSTPPKKPKDLSLGEVKEHWNAYIKDLRQHVPQMLYFQMQRVEPIQLKNGELLLQCNDDFAKKIVDENKRRLGKLLQKHIGAYLPLESKVRQQKSNAKENMSPYERFKQLQERDPTIKKLVELFGAELDYNLSQ